MKQMICLLCMLMILSSKFSLAQDTKEKAAQIRDTLANDPNYFLSIASAEMKWNEPEEPIKIVGPIYFVGTKGLSSFLITGNSGHKTGI